MEISAKMPTIKGKMNTLTAKEERFIYEYCIDLNATRAAIRAGYSHRTAKQLGSRLLTKVDIQRKIADKQSDLSNAAGITALRIVRELEKIAFSNIGNLHLDWKTLKDWESLTEDQKSCIQEVTTTPGKYGTTLNVKFYNKQGSLTALANILGIKAPIRNEITGKDQDYSQRLFIEIINRRDQVDPESKKVFGM